MKCIVDSCSVAGFQLVVSKFFIFFVTLLLTTLCGAAVCFFISASFDRIEIANICVILIFLPMSVCLNILLVGSQIKHDTASIGRHIKLNTILINFILQMHNDNVRDIRDDSMLLSKH